MTFLTDFADQAVVLPTVAAVTIFLMVVGWRRGALTWIGVIGVTLGAVLILKLSFLACGPVFGPWGLRSPSGHTASAAVAAGGMAALLSGRPWAALSVALLAGVAIGLSRVVLGLHSVPEAAIGALVGLAGAAVLTSLAGPPPRGRRLQLLAIATLVAVLLHGTHLHAEAAIRTMSSGVLDFVPACRGEPPP